jgi:hypothetical protein
MTSSQQRVNTRDTRNLLQPVSCSAQPTTAKSHLRSCTCCLHAGSPHALKLLNMSAVQQHCQLQYALHQHINTSTVSAADKQGHSKGGHRCPCTPPCSCLQIVVGQPPPSHAAINRCCCTQMAQPLSERHPGIICPALVRNMVG